MLERRHVTFYARSSGVPEDRAERDIVLTYVLRIISDSMLPRLAFKGGTCLKKIYFGKTGRFSMDLDFTAINMTTWGLQRRVKQVFNGVSYYGLTFRILDEYSRVGDSYGAILEYSHDWNRAQFKLEVSFREKPILEILSFKILEELYFRYCEFKPFEVPCLRKEELLAEKIRAACQRMSARDLYDLYLFVGEPYDRELVKRLTVFKFWDVREPFDPDALLTRVGEERLSFSELRDLVREGRLPSRENMAKAILEGYSYLKDLDEDLIRIVRDSRRHRRKKMVEEMKDQLSKQSPAGY